MRNIQQKLSSFFHQSMWDEVEFSDDYCHIYEIHPLRDKYVEPTETFIYSLPYGASDLDNSNTFI